jgi:hypothetical protein
MSAVRGRAGIPKLLGPTKTSGCFRYSGTISSRQTFIQPWTTCTSALCTTTWVPSCHTRARGRGSPGTSGEHTAGNTGLLPGLSEQRHQPSGVNNSKPRVWLRLSVCGILSSKNILATPSGGSCLQSSTVPPRLQQHKLCQPTNPPSPPPGIAWPALSPVGICRVFFSLLPSLLFLLDPRFFVFLLSPATPATPVPCPYCSFSVTSA